MHLILMLVVVLLLCKVLRGLVSCLGFLMLLVLVYGAAHAATPQQPMALVFNGTYTDIPVGDHVGAWNLFEVLYLDTPCTLPIVGAKEMYRYTMQGNVGCWYPTLGGGYTIIQGDGRVDHHRSLGPPYQPAVYHGSDFVILNQ